MVNEPDMIACVSGEVIAPEIESRALVYIARGLMEARERGDAEAAAGWKRAEAFEKYAQITAIQASFN